MAEHAHAHTPKHYVKIWAILLALLVVSVVGPELGIPVLTLVTAFGIAVVKAYLVAKHFMHLNLERKYVGYIFGAMLFFMLVFFAGVAPDVLKHDGRNWENVGAKQETERVLRAHPLPAHGEGH